MSHIQFNRIPLPPAISFRANANDNQPSSAPYSANAELEREAMQRLWGGLDNINYLQFCNMIQNKILTVGPNQPQVVSSVKFSQDAWNRLVIEDQNSAGGVFVLDTSRPIEPFFRKLEPNERAVLYPNQWIGFSAVGPYVKLMPHWFPAIPVIKGCDLGLMGRPGDPRSVMTAVKLLQTSMSLSQVSLDSQLSSLPVGASVKDERVIFKRVLINEASHHTALLMSALVEGCLLNGSDIKPGMAHLLRPDDQVKLPGTLPIQVKKSWFESNEKSQLPSIKPEIIQPEAKRPYIPVIKLEVKSSVFDAEPITPKVVQGYLTLLTEPGNSLSQYFQWAREVLGVPKSEQKNLAVIRKAYQDLFDRFGLYTEDLAKRFTPDEHLQLQKLLASAREILEAGVTVPIQ